MANIPIPYYYNQFTAKERSYFDYMGEVNKSISSEIESNTNRQIAANAIFANELNSTLINNQIATETALYNHTQQLDNTLISGFSGVSRQLGDMGSAMNMRLSVLNNSLIESTKSICSKLDAINETLKTPKLVESRELYNSALRNYKKGYYTDVEKDLINSIKINNTDPFSHFLLGQTYLFGISEIGGNVINLGNAIESLRNAAKYIHYDAKTQNEARLIAAEIWFYLGLAYHTKANDDLHNNNKADYQSNLNEAKSAYMKSWEYSNKMLESIFNLARCKVLTNDKDGAMQDLFKIVFIDQNYFSKIDTETDFDNEFKKELFYRIKKGLYPKAKLSYDRIQEIKNNFKGPYSNDLNLLMIKYLPLNFTEDATPFNVLIACIKFPEILIALEKEQKEHIQKINELEYQKKQAQLENERRAEQEKRQQEVNRQREKEELEASKIRQKQYNKKVFYWNLRRSIPFVLAVASLLYVGIQIILGWEGDAYGLGEVILALLFLIGILVILSYQFFAKSEGIWPIIVTPILSLFLIFYSALGFELGTNALISCTISFIASIIVRKANKKEP